ncbi:MAG: hypothetical protein ACLGI3_02740 [Actinomycetes bacterium]
MNEHSLDLLALQVPEARNRVGEQRRGPANTAAVSEARRRLREDLERFVNALEARNLPVPPGLRDELALHQRLGDQHSW